MVEDIVEKFPNQNKRQFSAIGRPSLYFVLRSSRLSTKFRPLKSHHTQRAPLMSSYARHIKVAGAILPLRGRGFESAHYKLHQKNRHPVGCLFFCLMLIK